jgi:hypothetical protein
MGSMKIMNCWPRFLGNIIPTTPVGREIPLPFSFINDPKHWRQRAEEALALADRMNDLQAKAVMIRISYDYESLAKRAEERELRHSMTV